MTDNLTLIVPYFNGASYLPALAASIPEDIPVIVVDDLSAEPLDARELPLSWKYFRLSTKGYFSGAVNFGIAQCETDVLILNQDVYFENDLWLTLLSNNRKKYAVIGEKIHGAHPAWPQGYIHGTFMFMRRDALSVVGLLDAVNYPLWGSTCEWQLRARRREYAVLMLDNIPGFTHVRGNRRSYGSSIAETLAKASYAERELFLQTPPLVSVIVPCYNYGRYIPDLVASLVGGTTDIGKMSGQTLQSFEIIIVDDVSTDDSVSIIREVIDDTKGIRLIRQARNKGASSAMNQGIRAANGKYITRMDADDMREPRSFELMVKALEENPHSVVYDNVVLFSKSGGRKTDIDGNVKVWGMRDYDFNELIRKNFIHAGIMFPKEAYGPTGGYPEEFVHGREDWAFNVALGVAGYCGIHLDYPGYLYRREGQNRTERNTTPQWREVFVGQIRARFSEIFAGRRPDMCCGRGETSGIKTSRSSAGTYDRSQFVVGSQGMALLEYQGGNYGNQTFYGPVSGVGYKFSKLHNRRNVDVRDLRTEGRTGLLDLFEGGSYLFKQVNPEEQVVESPQTTPTTFSSAQSSPEVSETTAEIAVAEQPVTIIETDLPEVRGIGKTIAGKLYLAGIKTVEELAEASLEAIAEAMGWEDVSKAVILKDAAQDVLDARNGE